MNHIVLLGDSIFDNKSYVRGGLDVVAHLRQQMPATWKATLLAVDGNVKTQVQEFNGNLEVNKTNEIPHTDDIPLNFPQWLQIPDVICVFVDMKISTKLSASTHGRSTSNSRVVSVSNLP